MLAIDNDVIHVRRGHSQIVERRADLRLAGRLQKHVDIVLTVVGHTGREVKADVVAGNVYAVTAIVVQFSEPAFERSTVVFEGNQADLRAANGPSRLLTHNLNSVYGAGHLSGAIVDETILRRVGGLGNHGDGIGGVDGLGNGKREVDRSGAGDRKLVEHGTHSILEGQPRAQKAGYSSANSVDRPTRDLDISDRGRGRSGAVRAHGAILGGIGRLSFHRYGVRSGY